MTRSHKNILFSLLAVILAFAIFSLVTTGSIGSVALVFLSLVIGPYMGLAYPFPMLFKLGYSLTLIIALCLVGYGIAYRQRVRGQFAIVTGVVLWAFAGLLGLGTGT